MDEPQPIAWTAIPRDTPVLAEDGQHVGKVIEVLGSREEDVFHGLVIEVAGAQRVLLADGINALMSTGIVTDRSALELAELPPYEPGTSYHAGLSRGLFGHLKSEKFFKDPEDG